jgi:hypothetical protein
MLLDHRFHGLQLGEMLAHVRVEDHIDDQVAELPEVSLLHVGEYIAIVLGEQPVTNQ